MDLTNEPHITGTSHSWSGFPQRHRVESWASTSKIRGTNQEVLYGTGSTNIELMMMKAQFRSTYPVISIIVSAMYLDYCCTANSCSSRAN